MFESGESPRPAVEVALGQLTAAIDTLTELDLTRLDRDELLALLRGLETQRRRLPVVDHALVAELDQRGVAGELAAVTPSRCCGMCCGCPRARPRPAIPPRWIWVRGAADR